MSSVIKKRKRDLEPLQGEGEDDHSAHKRVSSPPERKEVFITNIVSVSKCDHPFVLQEVVFLLKGKYGNVFPAVVSLCRNTGTSFNIFRTGSIINTGSDSKPISILSMVLLESYLSRVYRQYIRFHRWKVINIVVSMVLGFEIDMDAVNFFYSHINGTWRPSIFQGFSIRSDDLHVSFTVFKDSSVNVTGLRSLEQIPLVQERAYRLFYKCRKT
jgi:TATA-box binding protein (TBP) (component of TFIID and TFIIIB)